MRTLRLVTAGCAGIALVATLVAPGAARQGAPDTGERTKRLDAKHDAQRGTGALRRPKVSGKAEPAGRIVHPALTSSPALQKAGDGAARAAQFRGRAQGEGSGQTDFGPSKQKKASNRKALGSVTTPAGKRADKARFGTGGGDVVEVEPNDNVAQLIDDVPVNVIGVISRPSDVAD
jgi:hypothetical protein